MTPVGLRNAELLASVRPVELGSYLRANGWQEQSVRNGRAQWTHDGDFEVVLPLRTDFRDYVARIADALRTLEAFEERRLDAILHDIQSITTDIIRVRVGDSDARDGTLPIDRAAELISRARDMIMAAACSEVAPKLYYPSRKPAKATEYLQKVRMGQTELGSFVVTIVSPVAPSLQGPEQDVLQMDDPFERRVTRRLSTALTSLTDAVGQSIATNTIDAFEAAVPHGVSANLVDAVLGLSSHVAGSAALEIGFSWAAARPLRVLASGAERILITQDSQPILEEVARIFKAKSPREEFELRGPVISLRREDPNNQGEVTVVGVIDGQPRRVTFEVSGDDYRTAIKAHEQNNELLALGILTRTGRSYILRNPRGLELVEETD